MPAWAEEYARCSRHDVELLTLSGRHWKWRMHGGAVTLARQFLASGCDPDLLLVSDMLDLTTFLALTREKTSGLPTALYFHENQLTYPWSPGDADPVRQRDAHYAFINYTSALAADAVLFNSRYHLEAFAGELPAFLKSFPDQNELGSLALLAAKSAVLPLALDLRRLDQYRPEQPKAATAPPLILWNHRWEYDKDPEEFFAALFRLQEEGLPFEVAILGESYRQFPPIFAEAQQRLGRADRPVRLCPGFRRICPLALAGRHPAGHLPPRLLRGQRRAGDLLPLHAPAAAPARLPRAPAGIAAGPFPL